MGVMVFYNGRHDDCDIGHSHSHTRDALPLYSVEKGNVPEAFLDPMSGKKLPVPTCEDCGGWPDEFTMSGMICAGCMAKRHRKKEADERAAREAGPKCPCGAPGKPMYYSFTKMEVRCDPCAKREERERESAVKRKAEEPTCGQCKKKVAALVRGKDFCYSCENDFKKKHFTTMDKECRLCEHAPDLHMATRGCAHCLCRNTHRAPNYAGMIRLQIPDLDKDLTEHSWDAKRVKEEWGKLYHFPGAPPTAPKVGWFRRLLVRAIMWLHRDPPARPSRPAWTLDSPHARAFFERGPILVESGRLAYSRMADIQRELRDIQAVYNADTTRIEERLKVLREAPTFTPEQVQQLIQKQ